MHPLTGPIASRNHPAVKAVRSLQVRAERDRRALFVVEGMRFIAQALERRAAIEKAILAPAMLSHPFARKLLRQLRRAGVPCLEVTPEVFHSVTLSEEPQGISAVVRQWWEPLPRPRAHDGLCWIALSEVRSPGNLGAILRTADAVGAAGLILLGDAIDPFDPGAVRATMGSIFTQRFVRTTPSALATWKRRCGYRVLGTSSQAEADYRAAGYGAPLVLFMGCERRGIAPEHLALCDQLVRIPMVGSADSLNLAVATGVMLYEAFNQRERVRGAGET